MKTKKLCPTCKISKDIDKFSPRKACKDGHCYQCLDCERAYNRNQQRVYGLTPRGRFHRLKAQAIRRQKAEFLITANEFITWFTRQPFCCYYCEQPLLNGWAMQHNTPTIDRKDNAKPYTIENIVLCCWRCNLIKGPWFTEGDMLEIASKYLKVLSTTEHTERRGK